MLQFVSVGVAALVCFVIPETNKYSVIDSDKIYSQQLGFPYQYFKGEVLTGEEVHYRLRLTYISVMFGVSTSFSLLPLGAVMLPPPAISRISPSTMNSIKAPNKTKMGSMSVISNRVDKITFSDNQRNQFHELGVKWKSSSISEKELLMELRGGNLAEWVAEFGIGLALIIILQNIQITGFEVPPGHIVPPHLQHLYGNQKPGNHFGYGKNVSPQSITVTGATQNANSEKREPSNSSYGYMEIMSKLNHQSSKKRVNILVADQMYTIKNPYREDAYELGYKLADQIYDSIRESDTDICDIAENLGFKADNIKNVKDHVFYQKHELDQYVSLGEASEYKRFDPYIQQALAWKRLETGTHTQDDITWIKHECAERHHELKYGSGYSEAHNRAQTRFDGAPWENNF